ncbi:MAG: hypothetical protein ACK4FW_01005, partial [Stenotrophomonas sp.]
MPLRDGLTGQFRQAGLVRADRWRKIRPGLPAQSRLRPVHAPQAVAPGRQTTRPFDFPTCSIA